MITLRHLYLLLIICLFLTSQASNQYLKKAQTGCQIVKPFPNFFFFFFTVFTDNVTLTHLLLLLGSVLSVLTSFVFPF